MRELLLTLGHNSSAILIEDGDLLWGYETERVTGVKSDSRFPLPHLEQWGATIGKVDLAHVTHWSPDDKLSSMSEKHWNPALGLEGVPIHTLDTLKGRSHHDTHMAAAMCYADSGEIKFPRTKSFGLVIDGFGTLGEHFSVYELWHDKPKCVRRYHGYDTSLGLLYQYATAFLGLKMHEDEYKLLGYEVHVSEKTWYRATDLAIAHGTQWLKDVQRSVYGSQYDPIYDIKSLTNTKALIFKRLTEVAIALKVTDIHGFEGRAAIACYVQTFLEWTVTATVKSLIVGDVENLVLSGGCFYNVKLNRRLINHVTGKVCVYPLAGDQGNALGLYAMAHPEWKFPKDLFWGKRVLRPAGLIDGTFCGNEDQVFDFVIRQLKNVGYVNLVRGGMEFGPRALCNTSTLALPTRENVEKINAMNERNTVMPMAPVMTRVMYNSLFEDTHKVWKSEQHMIVALEHKEAPWPRYEGVCHKYEYPCRHHTSRPQVIGADDLFMNTLLDEFGGMLINTSFNFHGKPIALGMSSVVLNHLEERRRDGSITTAVITNDI